MAAVTLEQGRSLLVAERGTGPEHGLWQFAPEGDGWHGRQLATVGQLSSLCRHPVLPIVYGTASARGVVKAWRVADGAATSLGEVPSAGDPCHLAVDPSGRLLVAANYGSSTLTLIALGEDGSFGDTASLVLEGQGPDAERQEAAHPHQVLFHDGLMLVVDLGADLVRRFAFDLGQSVDRMLTPIEPLAAPAGSGPRHGVFLPDGRLALSGELGSSLIVESRARPAVWESTASTLRRGAARSRTPRNYPGDVQRSEDGRFVYLANRGHDTIAAFDVTSAAPRLVAEVESGGAWPQHLLVLGDRCLVANWDSNLVTALGLTEEGFDGAAEPVFDCPGPGWLLLF
jgi:6-phosphogluconolactonase